MHQGLPALQHPGHKLLLARCPVPLRLLLPPGAQALRQQSLVPEQLALLRQALQQRGAARLCAGELLAKARSRVAQLLLAVCTQLHQLGLQQQHRPRARVLLLWVRPWRGVQLRWRRQAGVVCRAAVAVLLLLLS